MWRSQWSWAHGLVVGDGEGDEVAVQFEDQSVEGGEVGAEGGDVVAKVVGGGDGERRKMNFPTIFRQ